MIFRKILFLLLFLVSGRAHCLDKNKPKILFIVHKFPRLTETFVLSQINGLIENGFDITIWAREGDETYVLQSDVSKYNLLEKILYIDFYNSKTQSTTLRQNQNPGNFALLNLQYNRKKIVVYKFLDNRTSCYVFFIKDGEDNHYIVKQKRKDSLVSQFRVVFEMLNAYIAEIVEIPAHRVRILPMGIPFPGKFVAKKTATIHTLVPGCQVKQLQGGPYYDVDIKQYNHPLVSKYKMGLNRKVIADMALHSDLPLIVALDTFIGNRDRNPNNYFYDQSSDRFYAIDMDEICDTRDGRILVSKLACSKVRGMLKNNEIFNRHEIKGLQHYQATLKKLVDNFPPRIIYMLIDQFALQAGFKKKYYVPEILNMVNQTKMKIEKTYYDIQRLINLISQLIESQKNSNGY